MKPSFASNLFKGRIGEAVIEAVLTEFGYKVRRGGYELALSGNARYAPDLVVDHPDDSERKFVEVKYRSARPTSVQLDLVRAAAYRRHFPGTIIAICSAWDGSIASAEVEDIPNEGANGTQRLNLLDDYWQPIWKYFPFVEKGERLRQTWESLRASLETFGTRQVTTRRTDKLWDGEYEALADYLFESWTEDLRLFGIEEPAPDTMTLKELWEVARRVNAGLLVLELMASSEEQIVSSAMTLAIHRALGERGETSFLLDLDSLERDRGRKMDAETRLAIAGLISGLMKRHDDDRLKELASRITRAMPDGIGDVYLLDQGVSFENTERVDLKTAIRLIANPRRIDL